MIEVVRGDIFESDAQAIVNTVNCVGVMGKGIALEFKKRYPDMFKEYVALCRRNMIQVGSMWTWENTKACSGCNGYGRQESVAYYYGVAECSACDASGKEYPQYIINFPTKEHWKNPSKLEWISDGLDDLKDRVIMLEISSLALPALGCKNGGLSFEDVRVLIERKLNDLEIPVILYEPQ